ncbi:MAG: urea transporter [Ignavibacteriaceae bacterium]|nr:urea transporter [Ignavibacteriaceae bacterium]
MKLFINAILYSYAQIFFSNRKWFGLLALISTFVFPEIGLLSLLGVVISNFVAVLLKFDKGKTESGFYGFNGLLFGASTAFYYQFSLELIPVVIIFIILTFLISSVLENYMEAAFNLPGLSLPFILSLYIFLIYLGNYTGIESKVLSSGDLPWGISFGKFFDSYFHSLAFILFQPGILTGIVLAAGLLLFSRVLFLLSLIAFTLNYYILMYFLPDYMNSFLITTGFNAILTAFALGGSLVLPSRKSLMLVVISTLLVVIMYGFFYRLLYSTYLPVLVLPFNFIVLSTIYSLKFRQDTTDLVLLYFKPGSPEENLYYHNTRKKRFDRFKYYFAELPVWGEWYISQAFEGEHTHKNEWKFAWDFIIKDNENKEYSDKGYALQDYYCYKLPVVATLEGKVVKVVDGIPDNKPGDINIEKNWGNTVIIDHFQGLYSAVSHLVPGSIKVKEGDVVKKGDLLGTCGNSGRSPYPHIHFQFQLNNKVGDYTYKFPIAHFIENNNGKYRLRTFDYPELGTRIQNIVTHKTIRGAFDFSINDEFTVEYQLGGKTATETWKCHVNIMNQKYLENNKGDMAFIYPAEKIFYLSNYTGAKNSALYYFFLAAYEIPLTFHENLEWESHYSYSLMPYSLQRYITEFFLFLGTPVTAAGSFHYEERHEDDKFFRVHNDISIQGHGLFRFIQRKIQCSLTINEDGVIDSVKVSAPGTDFETKKIEYKRKAL